MKKGNLHDAPEVAKNDPKMQFQSSQKTTLTHYPEKAKATRMNNKIRSDL